MLGGSSAINAEAFIAPSRTDLDEWEKLGNPGWGWQKMVPYYKKFHTLHVPSSPETQHHLGINWINEDVRGTSGPIQASFQGVVQDPLSKAWVDTFGGISHALKTDPFSGEAVGGYSSPITVDPVSKTRSYSANTYLVAAQGRQNLDVVTGATVNKVLLDSKDDGVVATGVEVSIQGQVHTVEVRKEVIMAAGAFQTPKILQLSGIGRADLLEHHGVPLVLENPNVGENLQDHLMTGLSFEVNDGIFTGDGLMRQEEEITGAATQMYSTAKAGPLCAGGIGSYAFMPVMEVLADDEKANLKRLVAEELARVDEKDVAHFDFIKSIVSSDHVASGSLFLFPAQVNLHNDPKAKDFLQNLLPGNFVSLGAALLHPLSRGSVHIASSNPEEMPLIDPRYLSHPLDVEILARFVKFLDFLASSKPLVNFLKPGGKRNHATAHIQDHNDAKDYVKSTVISNNHPACTCAMKPKDKGGVVDEHLIVHGTRNLRIVDASIMPTIPGGNIQSSVYAVAERAADLIKGHA